jgi:hypothetical protein
MLNRPTWKAMRLLAPANVGAGAATTYGLRPGIVLSFIAGFALTVAAGSAVAAPPVERPVAGKVVHFGDGTWSAAPQPGPDGKVRQCVLVAFRPRAAATGTTGAGTGAAGATGTIGSGTIDTRLSLDISRGSGLVFALGDDKLPAEPILDDQAEIAIDDHAFAAVAFTIADSNHIAMHPGDAVGALAALEHAKTLRLHSDGAGFDTGPIALDVPPEAIGWLEQCSKVFNIAIDRPTDPDASPLPMARPRSPEIAPAMPTAAGPPGIEDKQRISGWDGSELRTPDGRIGVCMIRKHWAASDAPNASRFASFLMVSRVSGLFMMLKDPTLALPGEPGFAATLTVDDKPFTPFTAHRLGDDEIGIFPQHGAALAAALGDGTQLYFKSSIRSMAFPVPAGVVPWLRACTRRNGFAFEAPAATGTVKPN